MRIAFALSVLAYGLVSSVAHAGEIAAFDFAASNVLFPASCEKYAHDVDAMKASKGAIASWSCSTIDGGKEQLNLRIEIPMTAKKNSVFSFTALDRISLESCNAHVADVARLKRVDEGTGNMVLSGKCSSVKTAKDKSKTAQFVLGGKLLAVPLVTLDQYKFKSERLWFGSCGEVQRAIGSFSKHNRMSVAITCDNKVFNGRLLVDVGVDSEALSGTSFKVKSSEVLPADYCRDVIEAIGKLSRTDKLAGKLQVAASCDDSWSGSELTLKATVIAPRSAK